MCFGNKAGKTQERIEEKRGWISQGAEVCTFHDKTLFLVQSREEKVQIPWLLSLDANRNFMLFLRKTKQNIRTVMR